MADIHNTKTQFVVTLDSLDYPNKNRSPKYQRKEILSQSKRAAKLDTGGKLKIEQDSRNSSNKQSNKPKTNVKNDNEIEKSIENNSNKIATKRKRTPIRFDVDDTNKATEAESPAKKRRSKSVDRKSIENVSISNQDMEKDENNRNRDDGNSEHEASESSSKIRTRNSSQSKYDNLPPCNEF